MNIVLFNPDRIDMVFIAAAAMKESMAETAIIPAKPSIMKVWAEEANEQIQIIREEEREKSGDGLDGLEEELIRKDNLNKLEDIVQEISGRKNRFFLLGLGPDNPENTDDLLSFFSEHKEEIILWVDDHKWPKETIDFINQEKKILFTETEPVLPDEYSIPAEWQEARRAIINHDLTNRLANRYLSVFATVIIAERRAAEEGYGFITLAFTSIVQELLKKEDNSDVTQWEKLFPEIALETEKAEKNISSDSPYFRRAKEADRPIGYLRLIDTKDAVDLKEVLKYGLGKFPWLCVIEYFSSDGGTDLIISSRRINIQRLIRKYTNGAGQEEVIRLYRELEEEVISTREISANDFLANIKTTPAAKEPFEDPYFPPFLN